MSQRPLGRAVVRRGWFAALAGLVGLGGAAAPAIADPADYRAATTAPASWLAFAAITRAALVERLGAETEATEPLRRRVAEKRAPTELIVQVWVTPGGTVSRVLAESVDTSTAALVQALVGAVPLGATPPPDMAQPLRLKVTLSAAP